MPWLPNVHGRAIDLVRPVPEQVDFAALAHALARINRSSGHPRVSVSVGLHTLIGLDMASPALKGLWLLHDAHEERTGDLTMPAREALERIAVEVVAEGAVIVRRAWAEFAARHDAAIHAAAGLSLPTPEQARALRDIDLAALRTERRDFYAVSDRPWHPSVENAEPSRRVWKWLAPDVVADRLLQAFDTWLPARRARAA